jgi:hypothetical protein
MATILVCCIAFVQGAAAEKVVQSESQAKLMARRAAIEDGYRQIAEIVYGIRLDSRTTVRDFVTQEDVINSRVRGVIMAARVMGTEYDPDGMCKVKMEVRVRELQKALGRKFAYPSDRIRVVGTGAPNPVAKPTPGPPPPQEEAYEWEELVLSATGTGLAPDNIKDTPRGRLLAERAAYVDAIRNLAENIKGVQLTSTTTVLDFVTQSDDIETRFEGWVHGAKKTVVRAYPDGTVEVEVELPMQGFYDIYKED